MPTSRVAALLDRHSLSEKHRAFVILLLEGVAIPDACERAGFQKGSQYYLLRQPAVAAALHEGVQLELQTDAPLNLQTLRKIRDNPDAPAGVRADIALKLMRLAGHVEPAKHDDSVPQKQFSEMTADELRGFLERNQAEIDRIEGELAARAVDVSAPDSAPNDPPSAPNFLE